ncbi:MAG: UDP-N-acetylmuramoyl-tripeptide--D-alanyl-D-alanine ligase [Phycisphaerales bacterium]|nr:UDP-N-acetylmuramoyl-tripeptide--D-alanyl-D-alanine ligase [Phycisphaerales bacterium]
MKPLSIRQVQQAVAGKALTAIPADAPLVTAVCTNSKQMEKGSLFIALRGDKHNAHEFLPDAAAGGAIAALVEEPPADVLPNVALIQVPDTRAAMGKLARHVRKQLRAKVITVAGSNGKTSTKHLIDAALRGRLKGSISPKSFNNDIGVPLTIFPADPSQDYLVLETGTNHHGEIKILSDMALPDVAVITNCGAEHLEGLDDLLGVRRENAQIISGLKARGLLVVNGDDPDLLAAVTDWKGQRVTFGFKEENNLFATDVRCGPSGTEFSLNNSRRRVFIPMLGRHSACNALAAIAVGRKLGVPEDVIIENLAHSDGPEMRLQLQPVGDVTVLNDAYNANPNSMAAAIETAAALEAHGRRIGVLGDMRELGRSSDRYHREIGQFAAANGRFDLLMCVGKQAKLIAEAAILAGFPENAVRRFEDAKSAATAFPDTLREGDLVLLKASRGVRLEEVAIAIAKRAAEAARKAAS